MVWITDINRRIHARTTVSSISTCCEAMRFAHAHSNMINVVTSMGIAIPSPTRTTQQMLSYTHTNASYKHSANLAATAATHPRSLADNARGRSPSTSTNPGGDPSGPAGSTCSTALCTPRGIKSTPRSPLAARAVGSAAYSDVAPFCSTATPALLKGSPDTACWLVGCMQ